MPHDGSTAYGFGAYCCLAAVRDKAEGTTPSLAKGASHTGGFFEVVAPSRLGPQWNGRKKQHCSFLTISMPRISHAFQSAFLSVARISQSYSGKQTKYHFGKVLGIPIAVGRIGRILPPPSHRLRNGTRPIPAFPLKPFNVMGSTVSRSRVRPCLERRRLPCCQSAFFAMSSNQLHSSSPLRRTHEFHRASTFRPQESQWQRCSTSVVLGIIGAAFLSRCFAFLAGR